MSEEERDRGGRPAGPNDGEAHLAQIAKALEELVVELKEVNTSLRAIARSQAQRATQKRPPQGS
jgi:cell division protein ZapA (FtsZ GTPase activity inhibitor)